MTPVIERVSRHTRVMFYYLDLYHEWRWSYRWSNSDSPREGLLATSVGGFPTLEQAKEDFYMNHQPQKAPWPLIIGLILAIAVMLATISLTSPRARAHDMYANWSMHGYSCCHDQDCFQSRVWQDEEGRYWALDRDGRTKVSVPPENIDPEFPTGGVSHVCIFNGRVLCAAVGTGG